MKAAVINNDKIEVKEFEKPSLETYGKGAVVKVLGSGLCGSDIIKYLHKKNGIVLGHEIVGEIVDIDSDTDFKTGEIVVMGHHIPCGNCLFCRGGSYSMCRQFKETNIIPGGFAEYIFASELHLKNTAHRIPPNLTLVEASFMEPLGCCVRAVERADLTKNSTIVVVGLGTIGLLMGQAIKACGHKVIGIDLIKDRLDLAKKFGFDEVKTDVEEGSADAIFLTAGADSTVNSAKKYVRNGGTILVFSSVKDDSIGFSNNDIYYRELKVLSSYSATPDSLKTSLQLLQDKKVRVDNLTTEYKLEDLQKAIDDTLSNKIMKAYIRIGQ